jgi:hypothetical protein
MRMAWAMWVMAAMAPVSVQCVTVDAHGSAAEPPAQLVREVVANELSDHARHGYWRYWIASNGDGVRTVREQIETEEGPVARLIARDGQELSPEAAQEEEGRLRNVAGSRSEQARRNQAYRESEERVGRILAMLPDAFLFSDEGSVAGCRRLRFRPNPDYDPHSIEARIFHAMAGELLLDMHEKRLIRLEGRLSENVDFGFGILGRLNKGGWFLMQRAAVSPTEWKTVRLEIHISGRALLMKTFAREMSETRGGFIPVPVGLTAAQASAELANQPFTAMLDAARFAAHR